MPLDKERIIIQYFENETDAFEAEKFLISFFGREDLGLGCLLNMTDGGDGQSGLVHKESSKEKIRQAQKGQKRSVERVKKTADALRGRKGRMLSEEEKQYLSDLFKGKPWSESRRKTQEEKPIRMATCHPDRKHAANGLCKECNYREWSIRVGRRPGTGKLKGFIPTCHPDRKGHAKGLCKACYERERLEKKRRAQDAL
jgi:hypothetical protein